MKMENTLRQNILSEQEESNMQLKMRKRLFLLSVIDEEVGILVVAFFLVVVCESVMNMMLRGCLVVY